MTLLGYGQSGAGKTSALIFRDGKSGLIIDAINELKGNELKVTIIDIYFNWDYNVNSYNEINNTHYCSKHICNEEIFTKHNAQEWHKEGVTLAQFVADKLKERLIQPTENNPESSRSHVLILLSLKGGTTNNIVIGDLAGVENKFTCQVNRLVQLHKIYQGEMYNGKYYFDIYGNN